MTLPDRNKRLGWMLALLAIGLMIYSFLVIKLRGHLPEPENLMGWHKIWRGL